MLTTKVVVGLFKEELYKVMVVFLTVLPSVNLTSESVPPAIDIGVPVVSMRGICDMA